MKTYKLLKETFTAERLGIIETTAGASGGVTYRPKMYVEEARELIEKLCELLKEKDCCQVAIYLCQI